MLSRADKEEMERRLDHCRQWYEVRFRRLRDLVKTLPEDIQKSYWNIVANGTADYREPSAYDGHMNLLRHDRDRERMRAGDLQMMLSRMIRATRTNDDPKVVAVRAQALTLLSKVGRAHILRAHPQEKTMIRHRHPMNPARVDAIVSSSYNLHIGPTLGGPALEPEQAAKLATKTRIHLCQLLADIGGSDLYGREICLEAVAFLEADLQPDSAPAPRA